MFSFVAGVVTFCAVQDRVTAAGARRYVALQREAMAGERPPVTVDEVMTPAIRRSLRDGLLSGGGVAALGIGAAALVRRNGRG